jgi:alcohol dehydrogenase (cytochrome c)
MPFSVCGNDGAGAERFSNHNIPGRDDMMRSTLFAALLSATFPIATFAQTADDLKNDAKSTGDVLVYGMGYSAQRFSPLTQINKENVSKLVPTWAYSLADLQGGEGFPIVKDGVIYVTTHNATVAVDAITGKQIWRVIHDYPPETLRVVCCGIVNRGAAINEGMIIRALMDDRSLRSTPKLAKRFGL